MPRTAPTISEPNRMLSTRHDLEQQLDAGLVIHARVEEHVVQHHVRQQRPLHVLREPAIAAPVIRHRAAAVRNDELQRREILEQIAL